MSKFVQFLSICLLFVASFSVMAKDNQTFKLIKKQLWYQGISHKIHSKVIIKRSNNKHLQTYELKWAINKFERTSKY